MAVDYTLRRHARQISGDGSGGVLVEADADDQTLGGACGVDGAGLAPEGAAADGLLSPTTSHQLKWIRYARYVSYVSIALTLLSGVGGLVLALAAESAAMLGYSLESYVDVFSSVLVLWRFWGNTQAKGLEGELEVRRMAGREKRASVGIAITFVGISVVVGSTALHHLFAQEYPEKAVTLLVISAISVVCMSVLSGIKLRISRALQSEAMRADGVTSAAVAVLSGGMLVSDGMFAVWPQVWWLDSVVALLVSLVLFLSGLKTLVLDGGGWWRKEFWVPSKELEMV